MKKWLAIAVLMVAALPAWAEWTIITFAGEGEGEGENFRIYWVDYETIIKDGNRRKVWQIIGFTKPQETGEMSSLHRFEHECKEKQTRLLAWRNTEGFKATGKILASGDAVGPWKSPAPGTVGMSLLKAVCEH